MKKYIAILLILTSCGVGEGTKTQESNTDANIKLISGSYVYGHVFVIEVDACQYVCYTPGGIVHKENCTNPIHK